MSLFKGVLAAALITTTLTNTSFAMDHDLLKDGSRKPAMLPKPGATSAIEILDASKKEKPTPLKALMAGIAAGAGEPSALLSDLELIKGSVSVTITDFDPTAAPKHNQILDGASALRSAITKAVSTVNDTTATDAAASHADTDLLSKGFNTKSSN